MAEETTVAQIQGKIERERRLIDGNTRMRQASANPAVQVKIDNEIRDSRRNIAYFEDTLRQLQNRQARTLPLRTQNGHPPGPQYGQTGYRSGPQSSGYGREDTGYGDPGNGGYSNLERDQGMPARGPFSPGAPVSPSSRPRPNYSKLDLIKYNTPHLGPRIQLMLSQLEFKLSVEKQYEDGILKIIGSYRMESDKKIRDEADGRWKESKQKIQLLQRALKRYDDLHVNVDTDADATDDDSLNAPNLRKPLTGQLYLRIHAISDVDHPSAGGFYRKLETYVNIKVEDEQKGRTKSTRNDKWTDEVHEIAIDKGNEVELTVYDKAGSDLPKPIGMIWIRISDIAEEMRRKKIETEINNSGWVHADRTVEDSTQPRPDLQFNPPPGSSGASANNFMGPGFANGQQPQTGPVVVDSWFALEPVGRIHLSMSFAKQTRERKAFDAAGLGRKGAIRQRKEDVHELYGHKFIAQQFYNIMRCALCGELLKYAVGYQCADCKYLCHEKCYPSVVTKCISRPLGESDPDEAKLNHRIPHRFETFGNIGAKCKLTCHAHCTHLVPDFCGMTMKDANRVLSEIAVTKARQSNTRTTLRPPGREPKPRPQPTTAPSWQPEPQDSKLSKQDRYSYGEDQNQSQGQQPLSQPSKDSLGAARLSSTTAQQLANQKNADRRPQAQRNQSSSSAVAAAFAATNALANRNRPPTDPVQSPYQRTTSYPSPGGRQQTKPQLQQPAYNYNPSDYANVDQGYGSAPQIPPPQLSDSQQSPQSRYAGQQYTGFSQSEQPKQPQIPIQSVQPTQPSQLATSAQPQSQPQPVITHAPITKFVEQRNQPPPAAVRGKGTRVGLDHFNFLAVLGKGNFGKVMLAETKSSKQLYAIKVLKKDFIIENDEVESTRSERDVFIIANRARHPFLLSLHACFQTETRVYFVMEYISGGDLMLHIQRGQFGTKRAQLYAAEVCLALKYFHENGVTYRDLKLDNILLTLDGHIKIADYGLCKKDMYYGATTSTFCGTPEFMAPEILLDKRYGRAVDWWAFGVLIYQMLLQQSPFRGEDEDEIYDAILADEPLYPIHMPRDSVSILQRLLTREPDARLGSGPTDAQEIMSHPFFKTVNWEDVYHKRVPAPFLPQIKSATDTSNFDSEFTSVTPVLTPVNSQLTPAMQEEFRGFSYSADFV